MDDVAANREDGMGWAKASWVALAAGLLASTPAFAGSWTFALEATREAPTLRYVEDGKTTFLMGCGHAFGLHLKFPGEVKKEGERTSVTIAAGKRTMDFKGEFENPTDDYATTFVQWDLGFRRQDPDLYEKKWDKLRDRLLDLLDSGVPLTISAGKASYKLPPVDAKDWRKPFEGCG
jgi:hypothetical protein